MSSVINTTMFRGAAPAEVARRSPRRSPRSCSRMLQLRREGKDDRWLPIMDRGSSAVNVPKGVTIRGEDSAVTLLFTDPLFLKHDTGRHPETSDRLRSITTRLEKAGLVKKCAAGTCKPLTEEAV